MDFSLSDILTPGTHPSPHPFFSVRYSGEGGIPSTVHQGLALLAANRELGEGIRDALRPMFNHFKNTSIIDAGDLLTDDSTTLRQLIYEFNKRNIIPVLIGLSGAASIDLLQAIEGDVYYVSNRPVRTQDVRSHYRIAYQRHVFPLEEIYSVEECSYNSVSLGKMRTYPSLLEAIMRDASHVHIDLNCLRLSDAPNVAESLPTGLHSEELCQLARYTGQSHHLKSVNITSLNEIRPGSPEMAIIAETIWYLAEGYNMNEQDHPSQSTDIKEFLITTEGLEEEYAFVRHNQSLKWWFRRQSEGQSEYLACSQEEFQLTQNGDLPERLRQYLEAQ